MGNNPTWVGEHERVANSNDSPTIAMEMVDASERLTRQLDRCNESSFACLSTGDRNWLRQHSANLSRWALAVVDLEADRVTYQKWERELSGPFAGLGGMFRGWLARKDRGL